MSSIKKNYIPESLSEKDKKKQKENILKSRRAYKKGRFVDRVKIKTAKNKPSKHVEKAKKMYNVEAITASAELSNKTGCSQSTLKKIVKKGKGAYYSSGSRPNQTPESWGRARLASAITGGKAGKVDKKEIKEGCSENSKVRRLLNI